MKINKKHWCIRLLKAIFVVVICIIILASLIVVSIPIVMTIQSAGFTW